MELRNFRTGRHLYWAGRPSGWASAHILVSSIFFDSRLILTLLCDSLNIVINAFSFELLGTWFRINEVESAAAVELCCTHNALSSGFPLSQGNAEALDR